MSLYDILAEKNKRIEALEAELAKMTRNSAACNPVNCMPCFACVMDLGKLKRAANTGETHKNVEGSDGK